jgi:Rieske Fe-S protein
MTGELGQQAEHDDCGECPLIDRRSFLRDATTAAAGALVALGIAPAAAQAMTLPTVRGISLSADEKSFPLPATDGALVDEVHSIIIARVGGKAYAFSLACPHQRTAVRWEPNNNRFQCPKHKSKYTPDGEFIEGRATRGLDRFAVRKDGANIVVNVDALYKQDANAEEWKKAFVAV